jgi:hypothetical protein
MKHLRRFNESNEVVEDLKDICMELEDEGFTIMIFDKRTNYLPLNDVTDGDINFVHSFFIMKPNRFHERPLVNGGTITYDYSEVKEVIERIEDYLGNSLIDVSAFCYCCGEEDIANPEWIRIASSRFNPKYKIRSIKITWE